MERFWETIERLEGENALLLAQVYQLGIVAGAAKAGTSFWPVPEHTQSCITPGVTAFAGALPTTLP